MLARLEPRLLGERAGAVAEPGGDDDGAAATPLRPALATIPGTVAGGVVTMIRSGTCARSSIRATQGSPSISRYFGLTSRIDPGNPASRRFRSTVRPSAPSR